MSMKAVKTGLVIPIRNYKIPIVQKGRSPYIDETTGNWFVFDDDTQSYVDTGVRANGSIVDDILSEESINPVQNKVVTKELGTKLAEKNIKRILPIDIDSIWENA